MRAFVSPPSFRRLSVRPSVVVPARLPVVLPLVLPVRLGLGGADPPSFLPLLLVFGWGGSLVGPGSLGVLARLGLGWAPARSETGFQVSPDFVNVQGHASIFAKASLTPYLRLNPCSLVGPSMR